MIYYLSKFTHLTFIHSKPRWETFVVKLFIARFVCTFLIACLENSTIITFNPDIKFSFSFCSFHCSYLKFAAYNSRSPFFCVFSDLMYQHQVTFDSVTTEVDILDTSKCTVSACFYKFYCCRPRFARPFFIWGIPQFSWPAYSAPPQKLADHLNSRCCDDVCGATNNLINYVLQLSVLEKVNLINKIKKVECAHTI